MIFLMSVVLVSGVVSAEEVSFLYEDNFTGVDDTTGFSTSDSEVSLGTTVLTLLGDTAEISGFRSGTSESLSHRGTRGVGVVEGAFDEVDGPEKIVVVFEVPRTLQELELRSLFSEEYCGDEVATVKLYDASNVLIETDMFLGVPSGEVIHTYDDVVVKKIEYYVAAGEDYSECTEFAVARILLADEDLDTDAPFCEALYLQDPVDEGITYPISGGVAVGVIGEFDVYGDAQDAETPIDNVQYTRTSPNVFQDWTDADPIDGTYNELFEEWRSDPNDPNFVAGEHQICCRAIDDLGNDENADGYCTEFCLDVDDPLAVTGVGHGNPSECVPAYVNEAPLFDWNAGEDVGCAGIDYYEVDLYLSNGTYVDTYSVYGAQFEVPEEELVSGQDYYVIVRAVDTAGNVGPASVPSEHVWYDTQSPVVEITSPDAETWYNDDFIVTEIDEDNLGLYSCEYKVVNDGVETVPWTSIECGSQVYINVTDVCPVDGVDTCKIWKRVVDNACNTDMTYEKFDLDRVDPYTTKIIGEHKYPGFEYCPDGELSEIELQVLAESRIPGDVYETINVAGVGTGICANVSTGNPEQCFYGPSTALAPYAADTLVSEGSSVETLNASCGDILILSSGNPADADNTISTSMGNSGCGLNPDGFGTNDCIILEGFTAGVDSVVLAVSSEWPEYQGSSFTDWMQIVGSNLSVDISIDDWSGSTPIIPYGPSNSGTQTLASIAAGSTVDLRIADSGDSIYDTALLVVPLTCLDEVGEALLCGNGNIDAGEQCDDGNLISGDGCSSICLLDEGEPEPEPNGCYDVDWFVTDETPFSFECEDNLSGCDATYYRIMFEGNPWSDWMLFDEDNFTLGEEDGIYYVEYYSVDVAGNIEIIQSEIDKLDNIAPITTKTIGEPQYYDEATDKLWVSGLTNFTFTCEDSEVGCAETYVQIDEQEEYYEGDVSEESYIFHFGDYYEDGFHTITYWSADHLWNTEEQNYEEDWLDNTPPEITVLNPTYDEAANVRACMQSVVVLLYEYGSGVAHAWAELWNDNGTMVREVVLTQKPDQTWSALMDKALPAGEYTLKIYAQDNVGNIGQYYMEELLIEGVFVEYVSPSQCQLDPEEGGQCDFTFNVCMRGGDSVQMWMDKLGGIVPPGEMNAMISKGNASTHVALWDEGPVPGTLDLGMGIVNGRTSFDLHLDVTANITSQIGEGAHSLDYLISAYLEGDYPEPEDEA